MKLESVLIVIVVLVSVSQFSNAQSRHLSLLKIEQNGNCGYIDRSGKVIISPKYDYCWDFSEGFACVVNYGKTGFIDESGAYLSRPIFDSWVGCYTQFREGFANVSVSRVRNKAGKRIDSSKWGFLDRKGNVTYLDDVTFLSGFREGLAFFVKGGLRGHLDTNFTVVIKPTFKSSGDFYDGRARATGVDGSEFYIDKSGNRLFDNNDGGEFQNGRAFFKKDGKYGFIDTNGKMIIESRFDNANHFGEDLAAVKIGNKWGFINEKGNIVIEPQFDEAGVFSEGLASVAVNDKWGFINRSGEVVIPMQYDKWTYWFENGIAYVRIDGKSGYIDKTGKYIWKPTK